MKETIKGNNTVNEKVELESINEIQAKEKLRVMDELDKIPYPIMCTVIMEPAPFEYRNLQFWKAFEQRDKKVREALTTYLNTKGK